MYSVLSYGHMAADGVRMDAYRRAIAQTVRPGSVVVDLGCGTGILSLLALRAGAARVHAIDVNPAVWLTRDLAIENGFGDELEVHHGSSFDVTLGQRADVILADMRGSCPLFEQNLALMEDARERLLAPGGVLLPASDRLLVALVEADAHRRDLENGWAPFERDGFKASAARNATLNCAYSDDNAPLLANHVISEAKAWTEIRYGKPFARAVTGSVDLAITRGGSASALAIWFEATVLEGLGYSNAPGQQLVYKRTVLPLLEPVAVAAGETARVTLRTDVNGSQWAWDTAIGGRPLVRQATFLGLPADPRALLRESLSATPSRSAAGDRANRILSMMDGTRPLSELADELAAAEPTVRRETIVDEIKTCARRYGR
jgi:type I protein arginine methyltransferase